MNQSQEERFERRLALKAHIDMTAESSMESIIATQLRIGVVISIVLIAIGSVLLFMNGGSGGIPITEIASSNSPVNSASFNPATAVADLAGAQALGFIFVGLGVLIITPVIRVAMSVLFFFDHGNWLYVAITLIVLTDLLFAIFIVPSFVPRVVTGPTAPG